MTQYVKCPSCGGIYHETTEKFDPDRVANGSMFRLTYPFGAYGKGARNWTSFPQDPAIRFADLECPNCGSCYVDASGRIKKLVKIEEESDEQKTQEGPSQTGAQKKKRAKKTAKK